MARQVLALTPRSTLTKASDMKGIAQLLRCRTASLETIRAVDGGLSKSALGDPNAHQVVVVAALQLGNDDLLTSLVSSSRPGPKHGILFGIMDKGRGWAKRYRKPHESGYSHANVAFGKHCQCLGCHDANCMGCTAALYERLGCNKPGRRIWHPPRQNAHRGGRAPFGSNEVQSEEAKCLPLSRLP